VAVASTDQMAAAMSKTHVEAHQAHIGMGYCLAVHRDGAWCYRRGNTAHVEHSNVVRVNNRQQVLKWSDVDGIKCECRQTLDTPSA